MNIESNKALQNLLHNQTQFVDGAGKEDEVVIVEDAVKKYKSEMEVYDKKAAQRVKVLNNRIQSNTIQPNII